MRYKLACLWGLFYLMGIANAFSIQNTGKVEQNLEVHLNQLLPVLLQEYKISGIAVAVIENGELSFKRTDGYSNIKDESTIHSDTIFNVGSVSKPMTAWGVMNLAMQGKVDLDAPVNRYLKEWQLQSDSLEHDSVSVRQLLSHTAGLSLSAVPEYRPDEMVPELEEYLQTSDDLYFIQEPGLGWIYSGGGYMVLQKMIEDVTGIPFEIYMKEEIMSPMGMINSSYSWSDDLIRNSATPYHEGKRTEYYRYTGQAAASLNSSLDDLFRWLIVSISLSNGQETTSGVLDSGTFKKMTVPAPYSERSYGLSYGLGYELWPLSEDSYLIGHNGQNTGWTSGVWMNPVTDDGLIVLINDSNGYNAWRWIFCDWIYWTTEITWRGICTGRPEVFPVLSRSRQ